MATPHLDAKVTLLDKKSLQRELSTAVDTERRRVAVDEMKKRAVTMAPTYDDFANLVKCAEDDLKPLDPGESFIVTERKVSNRVVSMGIGESAGGALLGQIGGTTTARSREDREAERLTQLGRRVAERKRAEGAAKSGAVDSDEVKEGKGAPVVGDEPIVHAAMVGSRAAGGKAGNWKRSSRATGAGKGKRKGKATADFAMPKARSEKKGLPRNGHEFLRHWRRNCKTPEARFGLLLRFSPEKLEQIFKTEIDGTVLGNILNACNKCWDSEGAGDGEVGSSLSERATAVVVRLGALTKAGRFALTIDLLGAEELETAAVLFRGLEAKVRIAGSGGDTKAIREVAKAYLGAEFEL